MSDESASAGADDQDEAVKALLAQVHERGDEGDFQGMAERLREGLADHPGDPSVLCWLGVAERELGLAGIAYERFRACLAARPSDPNLLATAGNAIAAFDDPEAEGALRTAALLAPDLPLARWLYGAYLIREGMFDDGLFELRAARELDPDDATVRYELGVGAGPVGQATRGGGRALRRHRARRRGRLDPHRARTVAVRGGSARGGSGGAGGRGVPASSRMSRRSCWPRWLRARSGPRTAGSGWWSAPGSGPRGPTGRSWTRWRADWTKARRTPRPGWRSSSGRRLCTTA